MSLLHNNSLSFPSVNLHAESPQIQWINPHHFAFSSLQERKYRSMRGLCAINWFVATFVLNLRVSQIKTSSRRHIFAVSSGQMGNKANKMRKQHLTGKGGGGPLSAFCSKSHLHKDEVSAFDEDEGTMCRCPPWGWDEGLSTDVQPGAETSPSLQYV